MKHVSFVSRDCHESILILIPISSAKIASLNCHAFASFVDDDDKFSVATGDNDDVFTAVGDDDISVTTGDVPYFASIVVDDDVHKTVGCISTSF